MSEPAPEYDEYDAWLDLRDVLEERDAEYWAATRPDDEASDTG